VSPPFRGIAQARAEFKLALLGRVKLLPHLKTFLPGFSCSNLLRPSTSKRKSALVRSLSIGPTEVDNPDFEDKLRNLDAQIVRGGAQIARVEAEIHAAEDNANAATNTKEQDYWRKEKEQLRNKEEQLREEKSDLRKLALLGGTAGTVAPGAPTPELLSLPAGPELNREYLQDEKERNKRIVYRRFRTSFKGPSFPAPYERARAVTEMEDVIERNLEQIKGMHCFTHAVPCCIIECFEASCLSCWQMRWPPTARAIANRGSCWLSHKAVAEARQLRWTSCAFSCSSVILALLLSRLVSTDSPVSMRTGSCWLFFSSIQPSTRFSIVCKRHSLRVLHSLCWTTSKTHTPRSWKIFSFRS